MKFFNFRQLIVSFLMLAASSFSFANPENEPVSDPLERFNRSMYGLNRNVDSLIIRPVAWTYTKAIPDPFRNLAGNFFRNLTLIPTIGNDILQGRFRAAATDLSRFTLNSTLGILGLFDVAGPNGMEHHMEDFGQTMMKWGYKKSTYLVLPFFGPSTFRDAVGKVPDYFMSYKPYLDDNITYPLWAAETIQKRSESFELEKIVKTSGVDEYIFVRNAYLQNRKYKTKNGYDVPMSDTNDEMLGEPPE